MRLIDVQPVLDYSHNKNIRVCTVDLLEALPVVDAVPVVRGEWIYSRTQSEFAVSKCSACGKEQFSISHVVKDGKYCPNCGAKMEAEP